MNKKLVRSWALYDWANSAFATTIMAAVLPIYYSQVAASGLDGSVATSYWGYTQSIAVLIVAILAPILGAISDYSAAKKKFLRFFAYMGMIASVMLAFVDSGEYLFASLLMIIGTVGFSGANVFYDAFLPEIAKGEDIDRVSSKGFAFGYIGGGLLLALNLLLIQKYEWFGLPSTSVGTKISFVSVGVWWFVFSIPLFKNIHEERKTTPDKHTSYIKIGFQRVGSTFKELNQYKQLLLFLVAFWLYNDGISTIIKMATSYGTSIGIGTSDLIMALLITQFVGIPFSFLFGWLATKISAKKALLLALYIYIGIVILGYFMTSALHFYALATCVGFVQGGAQALSRSLFGRMVPDDRHAEFFGFYGISSKFAAIFGPFLFALVGTLTGSSRLGIFSLVVFFIAGIILLTKVDVEKGEKEAQEATFEANATDVHT
ncbi:MFS transporter [Pontibacillus yanchengensis]|uniref:MFS transporter n=2 Tax=Pontibacillus yanchengensis TaxID=462910 RepID=A0ACC7VE50_9BACI|nr:MFS transporter [Pontibacillus yanchengensis]MYL32392.1 MFS transporter [Pontibacillus yanchengensis]MYL52972.1 MFS transporter [Pontibacillus yanchengensis]